MFKNRKIGKTLVSRTVGTKLAADGLRGRVFECNQVRIVYSMHSKISSVFFGVIFLPICKR